MRLLISILMAGIPLMALAGFQDNPTVVNGRSIALGRTSMISAAGSAAMFDNPAMMTNLKRMQITLGGRLMAGSIEDGWAEEFYDHYKAESIPVISLTHLSLVIPWKWEALRTEFAFGMGSRIFFDYGLKNRIESELRFVDEENVIHSDRRNLTAKTTGGLRIISSGVAIQIMDRIGVGVTYNKSLWSSIETTITQANSKEQYLTENSASFIQLGGLVRLSSAFTIGLCYYPAFTWKMSKEKFKLWNKDKLIKEDVYPRNWRSIPAILGLGMEYHLLPNWRLFAEYRRRKFPAFNPKEIRYLESYASCYRFGVEYDHPITIRFGFFKDAIALSPVTDEPIIETGFTFGTGINLSRISIDNFVEYSGFEYQEFHEGTDKQGYPMNDTFENAIRSLRIGLSASYMF